MPSLTTATLIGVSWNNTDSVISLIDENTGAGSQLGYSGFNKLNALARDESGHIYSCSGADLIKIDSATGCGVHIATLKGIDSIRGMAFSAEGVLYALHKAPSSCQLYTISVTDGTTQFIGNTSSGIQELDFRSDGTLYGWDTSMGLVTIDTATGATMDVNPIVGGSVAVQALLFGPDDTLYGARYGLYTINPSSGAMSLIGSGGYTDIRGIEFIPEPCSFLLLTIGGIALRKQQVNKR